MLSRTGKVAFGVSAVSTGLIAVHFLKNGSDRKLWWSGFRKQDDCVHVVPQGPAPKLFGIYSMNVNDTVVYSNEVSKKIDSLSEFIKSLQKSYLDDLHGQVLKICFEKDEIAGRIKRLEELIEERNIHQRLLNLRRGNDIQEITAYHLERVRGYLCSIQEDSFVRWNSIGIDSIPRLLLALVTRSNDDRFRSNLSDAISLVDIGQPLLAYRHLSHFHEWDMALFMPALVELKISAECQLIAESLRYIDF